MLPVSLKVKRYQRSKNYVSCSYLHFATKMTTWSTSWNKRCVPLESMRTSFVSSTSCLTTLENRNGPPNFFRSNRPVRSWSACFSQTMLRICCLPISLPWVTLFRMSCKESWTLKGSRLCSLLTSETALSSLSFSLLAGRLTKRPGRCQPLTILRLTK